MNWIKYYFRLWTGRCLSCGDIIDFQPGCYHCAVNTKNCHFCNKMINHAKNYGYYTKGIK